MPRITPCLWFDTQAQEAVAFYSGIFASTTTLRTTAPSPKSARHRAASG